MQPHTKSSGATVGEAEEEWGENCSPNVSPAKSPAALKPKSGQLFSRQSAQTADVVQNAAAGPADKMRHELEHGLPCLGAAEGQEVQQQQSREKLADIFAFLDNVEAQVSCLAASCGAAACHCNACQHSCMSASQMGLISTNGDVCSVLTPHCLCMHSGPRLVGLNVALKHQAGVLGLLSWPLHRHNATCA